MAKPNTAQGRGRVSTGGGGGRRRRAIAQRRRAATRRQAKRPSPILNPAQQLSGRPLAESADALVALEYGPQKTELARQAAENQNQGTALSGRASDYYRELAGQEASRLTAQQAIAATLDKNLTAIGGDAQTGIAAAGDQAAKLQAADTAVRGAGNDGGAGARVAEELAAARATATAQTQTARTAGATQGANYQGYQVGTAGAVAAAGGETQRRILNQIAQQAAGIRAKQGELATSEGAAKRKAILDLRQQSFENSVTSEGLGIKRADIEAQMNSDAADQALAQQRIRQSDRQNRRNNQTTRRGQNMTAAQRAADRKARRIAARQKAAQKKATTEPTDVRKMKTGITNAAADISTLTASGLSAQQKAQLKDAGATDLIRNGRLDINTARKVIVALGGPAIVAAAAAELSKYGGIRPGTAAQLRRLGMKVPKGWLGTFAGPIAP